MRRLAFLTAFSMMTLFVFAPAALAQDQYEEQAEIIEELFEDPQEPMVENVIEGQQEAAVEEQIEAQQKAELTPAQEQAIEPQAELEGVEPEDAGQPKSEPKGKQKEKAKEIPKTGGMSVGLALLPAAGLLLVGSGVLVLAALRRR